MYDADGADDVADFGETRAAMKTVGLSSRESQAVLSCVALVLQLGNLKVRAAKKGGADGSTIEGPGGKTDGGEPPAARLLGVPLAALASALTRRELSPTRHYCVAVTIRRGSDAHP